jgi:tetratricopeptide (TPR) repeat protein
MPPNPPQLEQEFRRAQERHFAGDFAGAASIYRALLKRLPKNGPLVHALGAAEFALGDLSAAREHLLSAIRLLPRNPTVRVDLASVYRKQGRFIEARRALEDALAIAPGDPTALAQLAETEMLLGNAAEAERWLREALKPIDAEPDSPAIALAFAKLAPRIGREEEAAARLARALASPGVPRILQCEGLFRLASLEDKLGRVDAAFESLRRANTLKHAEFDPTDFARKVDRAISYWRAERIPSLRCADGMGREAVFIVGMPRSGTTLVEQIIDSHPKAHGGGELAAIGALAAQLDAGGVPPLVVDPGSVDAEALARLARGYLEPLRRLGPDAEIITDKMPLNGLHLGLIWRMLPEARVIVCRRDPVDTCLSCYFHHFAGALPFAYDLAHLGAMHRAHDRLLAHWIAALPLRIMEVRYEELVADPEPSIHRILEFVGLPFDERCLHFHESGRVALTASNEQVRQPIYRSSVNRSARYRAHLGPLLAALELSDASPSGG